MASAASSSLRQRTQTSSSRDLHLHSRDSGEHGHSHGHPHGHGHGGHSHGIEETQQLSSAFASLRNPSQLDPGSRITLVGLVANVGLTALKGVAGYVLASSALLADAAHSGSDLVADVVTLASYRIGRWEPSTRYPYGYGKFESLGSLVVSFLLFATAAGICLHSYHHLLLSLATIPSIPPDLLASLDFLPHGHVHGPDASHTDAPAADGIVDARAMYFAAASIVIKEWLYRSTLKVARQQHSNVLLANAYHHRSDSLGSLVALVAIGAARVGYPMLDPLGDWCAPPPPAPAPARTPPDLVPANLARGHARGSQSPAHLDNDVIEMVHRTNTRAPSRRATRLPVEPRVHGDDDDDDDDDDDAPLPTPPRLLAPKKPLGRNPSFRQCLVNVFGYSLLNVLLVFVPVTIAVRLSHQSPTVIFVMSFVAIVPLAALLGFATEELALRVGDAFGGLLNATFGNAVELIIAILALVKGELDVVRSSMLGSILSNCLLVAGGAFFVGGIRFYEQSYSLRAAQTNINLLAIAVTAIVIPVGFHAFISAEGTQTEDLTDESVLRLSRGLAFILLAVYACYLIFQLYTHSWLYVPRPSPSPRQPATAAQLLLYADGPQPPTSGKVFRIPSLPSWGGSSSSGSEGSRGSLRVRSRSVSGAEEAEQAGAGEPTRPPVSPTALHPTTTSATQIDAGVDLEKQSHEAVDVEHEEPRLSVWFALGLLVVVTGLTGVTAEFLPHLAPVVGNAAEHVTALVVARKNKLDLSLAVAVGSSLQIALFVIPVLILLGGLIGQPLDLEFDSFETLLVFLTVCVVNWATIADGRTNWMEGAGLMFVYIIIATCVWFYPGSAPSSPA
ncbi:calciumion transporter [Rhodotorula toruloides]|uniref:Calciumion transporter n=1 Tax=Rhodotorula toruloides TaxID=5286 RepID=A0A511KR56_RHOTO|nr:calciumion transporter [Rhodotorula toruloides]